MKHTQLFMMCLFTVAAVFLNAACNNPEKEPAQQDKEQIITKSPDRIDRVRCLPQNSWMNVQRQLKKSKKHSRQTIVLKKPQRDIASEDLNLMIALQMQCTLKTVGRLS